MELEERRAAGEESRINLAVLQARIDSGQPLAAFPTDPDSDPTQFLVDEDLRINISVPAARNPRSAAETYNPHMLPGEYHVTTGANANEGILQIDRITDNDVYYYGAYLHRGFLDNHFSSTDAPDTTNGLLHVPGSGIIGLGLYAPINRGLSEYDVYQMQIRQADWNLYVDGTTVNRLYLHFWNPDGTKRTETIQLNLQVGGNVWVRNGVSFINATNRGELSTNTFFKDIYDANPGDTPTDQAARRLRFRLAGSRTATTFWQMGFGKAKGYTLQPEIELARALRTQTVTQAEYDALTDKDGSTFYIISDA